MSEATTEFVTFSCHVKPRRGIKFEDLTGRKFGKWTVIRRVMNGRNYEVRWLARCECGEEREVRAWNLKSGSSRSCRKLPCMGQDLTGARFGRWTVLRRSSGGKHGPDWMCKCDCGTVRSVGAGRLKNGTSASCGCYNREILSDLNTKHGMAHHGAVHQVYSAWQNMRARCQNPKTPNYYNYGGRGIKVSERWSKFENFLADMGLPPEKHSLDRIDNNADYCPENCRWADKRQQCSNTRRNRYIVAYGESLTLTEWGRRTGLNPTTIKCRLDVGRSPEEAVSMPLYG